MKGHSGRVAAIVCPSIHLSAVDSLGIDMGMGMEGTLIASCGLDRRVLLWDTSPASRARAASSAESAVEIAMGDAIARKIKSSSSDSRRGSRGEAEGESKVTDSQLPLALAIEPCMLYASGVYRGAEDAVRSAPGPLVGLCVCPSHSPASSKQKRLLGSEQEGGGGSTHRGGSFVLAAASAGQCITYCALLHVNSTCCMFCMTPQYDVPLILSNVCIACLRWIAAALGRGSTIS
jgi:hypothetical protein